jgi:hypothetical protein
VTKEYVYLSFVIFDVIRVIGKSRRMRWVENVARMGERRGVYRVFGGKT